MNYFKNKKHNLVRLVQGSILLTSITAPVILKTDSASAMLGSLARNLSRASTSTPSVSSLVSTFEKFSKTNQNTSSKLKNSTQTKSALGFSYLRPSLPTNSTSSQLPPKPQPKFSILKSPTKFNTSKLPEKSSNTSSFPPIITARGFTYLYGDESSSSTPYNPPKNTNPQNKITSSKVRIPTTSNTRNTPYSTKPIPQTITTSNDQSNVTTSSTKPTSSTSTPINNNQKIPKNLTYNLEIGNQLPNKYPSFELPPQQVGDLESMIKTNIATIVKQNLPPGFSKNQPITLHFDEESGKRLNSTLTSFMFRSAIRTLEAINKQ